MKGCIFLTVSATIIISLFSSCNGHIIKGEGSKTTQKIDVTSFKYLDISTTLKAAISVVQGATTSVELNGYDNLLKHIKTKIENNKLTIYSDLDGDWNFASSDGTMVKIITPSLDELSISGASDAEVHGVVSGQEFKLDISGAGKVMIDSMVVSNFSTVVSGAGDIEVRGGTAQNANYQVSGVGKIKAFPLQSSETVTSISGEGKAELTALQKLTVDINGDAKIKYKGHPTLTQEISGNGSITNAN